MDFTREPIIETVITPKEGCKLVVRSSKSTGQEEYFVDAVEVVSFGHSFFFRSLERPKMFFVPATDYEILEVREARMVLKNVGLDRTIKIGGGREGQMRPQREAPQERVERAETYAEEAAPVAEKAEEGESAEKTEGRVDKKRDRRRHSRRRRGREGAEEEGQEEGEKREPSEQTKSGNNEPNLAQQVVTTSILTSLLPPPPTLISETIAHYKDKFKDAFYSKDEQKATEGAPAEGVLPKIPLEQPEYGSFEVSEEEEERIYQQRKLTSPGIEEVSPEEGAPGNNGSMNMPEPFEGESNNHH